MSQYMNQDVIEEIHAGMIAKLGDTNQFHGTPASQAHGVAWWTTDGWLIQIGPQPFMLISDMTESPKVPVTLIPNPKWRGQIKALDGPSTWSGPRCAERILHDLWVMFDHVRNQGGFTSLVNGRLERSDEQ